jgi:hypothetical protein
MDPEPNLPKLAFTPVRHSPQLPVQQQQPSPSSLGSTDNGIHPQTQSSATEKPLLGNSSSEGHSPARDRNDPYTDFEPVPQPPPAARSRDGHLMRGMSRRTVVSGQAPVSASGLGWIVPVDEKPHVCVTPLFYFASILNLTLQRRTIGERLDPTIANAERERAQYTAKGLSNCQIIASSARYASMTLRILIAGHVLTVFLLKQK